MKAYRTKTCSCGAVIDLPVATDIMCQKCGRLYNRMGREITTQKAPFVKDRPPRLDIIYR